MSFTKYLVWVILFFVVEKYWTDKAEIRWMLTNMHITQINESSSVNNNGQDPNKDNYYLQREVELFSKQKNEKLPRIS